MSGDFVEARERELTGAYDKSEPLVVDCTQIENSFEDDFHEDGDVSQIFVTSHLLLCVLSIYV